MVYSTSDEFGHRQCYVSLISMKQVGICLGSSGAFSGTTMFLRIAACSSCGAEVG